MLVLASVPLILPRFDVRRLVRAVGGSLVNLQPSIFAEESSRIFAVQPDVDLKCFNLICSYHIRLLGMIVLPLITDAAGLWHIIHAVKNREDAVGLIVHFMSTARNNLVIGAVFASISSLWFHQEFLVNGAFIFSLISYQTIAYLSFQLPSVI